LLFIQKLGVNCVKLFLFIIIPNIGNVVILINNQDGAITFFEYSPESIILQKECCFEGGRVESVVHTTGQFGRAAVCISVDYRIAKALQEGLLM